MTIWSDDERRPRARKAALWALLGALPLLQTAYQVCAKEAANAMAAIPFGPEWLDALAHSPWALALLALEVAGFAAWMVVLAEMKLSAAFSLSAISYIMVVVTGWLWFDEPATATQVIGGALILGGVWVIGRDAEQASA